MLRPRLRLLPLLKDLTAIKHSTHPPEPSTQAAMSRRQFVQRCGYGATGLLMGSSFRVAGCSSTKAFDDLIDYDAVGLAALIAAKKVSPREVVEVVVKRVETINPPKLHGNSGL